MPERAEVETVLVEELGPRVEVVAAWLFGSVARGEQRMGSDVDVALLLDEPAPRSLDEMPADLADRLARRLGTRVDVVQVNDAPADLIHRVLRDGILLVDRNRSTRISFEVAARNRYFDMAPIWRRYRQARKAS